MISCVIISRVQVFILSGFSMRIPPFLPLALLAALAGSAMAQDMLAGDGWVVVNGFNGSRADGWVPKSTPSLKGGLADTPGEGQAVFLKGQAVLGPMFCNVCSPQAAFVRFGGLERRIPLAPWRGKHLRLVLPMKNEGSARGYVGVQINTDSGNAMRARVWWLTTGDSSWRVPHYVLEIPDNARELAIDAGFFGDGTLWLGKLALDTAEPDAPVTPVRRMIGGGCQGDGCSIIAMPEEEVRGGLGPPPVRP